MKEIIIRDNEAGQRFDKYLKKYMPDASSGFLYKMLRKKNIVLNGKKADGKEILHVGDCVKLFLSDETISKFSSRKQKPASYPVSSDLKVVYEDRDILLLNKPAGMLSQKAEKTDVSVTEYVIGYLLESGQMKPEELQTFHPSICNRLDRNTSGLIAAGKSLAGLQKMSALFKDRTLKKYYLCFVKGRITEPAYIRAYLKKDEQTNKVDVRKEEADGYSLIETEYVPAACNADMTLLKVHLMTGRTHQIRAHLASTGHPLLGDYKYGERSFNEEYRKRYGITSQILHAYQLVFPEMEAPFSHLSGRAFTADVPRVFYRITEETKWEHGNPEDLEALH